VYVKTKNKGGERSNSGKTGLHGTNAGIETWSTANAEKLEGRLGR
jgi:hypothetical protein